MFSCVNVQQSHYFSHTVNCYSTSIHPQSECSVLVPVSLRAPLLERPVDSDWSTVIGLSRHRPRFFGLFCNHGHAGDVAEGSDSTVVTSQSYENPDSSFKDTVSDFGLPWVEHFDTFALFI